jgi:hypothetical protein
VANARHPLLPAYIAEAPLVASQELLNQLNLRTHDLCEQLRPQLAASKDALWGPVAPLDVITLDFALVEDEAQGWGVRVVELQAFTSVVATASVLADIGREIWPATNDLLFHDPVSSWRESFKRWAAPHEASALVETQPWQQKTAFDFEAARQVLGVPVVALEDLQRQGGRLHLPQAAGGRPLSHILNRVILHTVPEPTLVSKLLVGADVSWHSHPQGYYQVSKAAMTQLNLPRGEGVARADEWRRLGLPASDLVLKAVSSFGGADVFLHVTEPQLDELPNATEWLVQPRYQPLAVRTAADGAPVFVEIRCVVALQPGVTPWTAARFTRMYRGGKASASTFNGDSGVGMSVLLSPPTRG